MPVVTGRRTRGPCCRIIVGWGAAGQESRLHLEIASGGIFPWNKGVSTVSWVCPVCIPPTKETVKPDMRVSTKPSGSYVTREAFVFSAPGGFMERKKSSLQGLYSKKFRDERYARFIRDFHALHKSALGNHSGPQCMNRDAGKCAVSPVPRPSMGRNVIRIPLRRSQSQADAPWRAGECSDSNSLVTLRQNRKKLPPSLDLGD